MKIKSNKMKKTSAGVSSALAVLASVGSADAQTFDYNDQAFYDEQSQFTFENGDPAHRITTVELGCGISVYFCFLGVKESDQQHSFQFSSTSDEKLEYVFIDQSQFTVGAGDTITQSDFIDAGTDTFSDTGFNGTFALNAGIETTTNDSGNAVFANADNYIVFGTRIAGSSDRYSLNWVRFEAGAADSSGDLNAVRYLESGHYCEPTGTILVGTVPEPSSSLLVALAAAGGLLRRKRAC